MKFVKNRSAILVTPKKPFHDWMAGLGEEPTPADSLDSLAVIYLVEECFYIDWIVENYWEEIFENELSGESMDEDQWPDLSLATFREWFDVKLFVTLTDLALGWIRRSRA
jgi:hypothetical protein